MKKWIWLVVVVMCVGCSASDQALGKTSEQVVEEADTNKDGKVSPEEWKASGWDSNQDGEIQNEELVEAMKAHPVVETVIPLLEIGAAFIPGLAGFLAVYRGLRRRRREVKSLVAGVEEFVGTLRDDEATTKIKLYAFLNTAKDKYGAAKSLTAEVAKIKAEIRSEKTKAS